MTHQISNNHVKIEVKSKGAELCSLKKTNESLEYIWQADAKYWNRHAPILFPIVGKLIDDEYVYEKNNYSLSQHGFARDCDFELVSQTSDTLCFKLSENESTLEKYPFYFDLFISYKLMENRLKVSYEVRNNSKKTMYFSIGAHPAFNWSLENISEESSNKDEYYFEFEDTNNLERLPLTNMGIKKEIQNIKLEENKLYINEELFKDDALVIQNLKNKTITLKNNIDNRYIKMDFEGFEYSGLWSKPSGADFVCIEPWHGVADFIEHDKNIKNKIGIKSLEENEIFESEYYIEI
ncbi:MAG: aldose 1-epimerase family protein [Sulfurovum sp.]